MTTHEAGWAHAAGALAGPAWLRAPDDVNDCTRCCGRARPAARRRRCSRSAGSTSATCVADAQLAGVRPRRGRLPVPGARRSATRSPAYDVFYAGKAFLCTTVARWIAEEGLNLDVCSGGELTVALRAGFDPARIGYHGNNKTYPELRRAVDAGVGRIIVDSFARDRPARRDRRGEC